MNSLYYVSGYHWRNNEWWRFALTADNSDAACDQIKVGFPELSRISAKYICETPDEVFEEL